MVYLWKKNCLAIVGISTHYYSLFVNKKNCLAIVGICKIYKGLIVNKKKLPCNSSFGITIYYRGVFVYENCLAIDDLYKLLRFVCEWQTASYLGNMKTLVNLITHTKITQTPPVGFHHGFMSMPISSLAAVQCTDNQLKIHVVFFFLELCTHTHKASVNGGSTCAYQPSNRCLAAFPDRRMTSVCLTHSRTLYNICHTWLITINNTIN